METLSKSTPMDVNAMDNSTSNLRETTSELISRHELKTTPFSTITTEDGTFVAMGLYRLTEVYETKEEAEQAILNLTWNNLINVMMIISEVMKDKSLSDIQNLTNQNNLNQQ